MVDIARESALATFAQLSTKASHGVYSVLDAPAKINAAVFKNARQGGAFGDSSAPDSMQPKSKNGRGYIVSHTGEDSSTFIKLLPNPFGNSIHVLKFVEREPRKRSKDEPAPPATTLTSWTEMGLEEILSTRQLLEVIGWLCLGLNIKTAPESASESFTKTLGRVTKVYELAVANMKANAAAKRSEKAVARAAAEKTKAFREAKKATAVVAKAAKSADGEVEEEVEEDVEEEEEADPEATSNSSSLAAQLAAKNKELEAMRQDLEVVMKHRNLHAARCELIAKRERINAKLERLKTLYKRQRGEVKNDLRTVVLADESEGDDADTDDDEDEEESEEEEVFEESSNKRARVF